MMQSNHLLYTVSLYQLSPQANAYTITTNLLAYRSFPVTMNNLLKKYPCIARDTNNPDVNKVKKYSKENYHRTVCCMRNVWRLHSII